MRWSGRGAGVVNGEQAVKENTMDDVEPRPDWTAVIDIARPLDAKYIPFELCAGDPGAVIAGMVSLVAISE